MIKKEVLSELRTYVLKEKEYLREAVSDLFAGNRKNYYTVEIESGRKLKVMRYLPTSASPRGDYEPPWANVEGVMACLGQLEELQGREFTDEEKEELEEYALGIFEEGLIKDRAYSKMYGTVLEYATYNECNKEELDEAIIIILENFDD